MTVVVEVPEGMKWCRTCGGVFCKETHFSVTMVPRKKCGTPRASYRYECKSCQWERSRIQRAAEAKVPPPQDLNEIGERIVEDCSYGEQIVYRKHGRIAWSRYKGIVPHGVELLGRLNAGVDWRDLRGSLES